MKELKDFELMRESAADELPIDGTEYYLQRQGSYSGSYDVVDAYNQPIYEIKNKKITNPSGAAVGLINRKLAAIPTYEIALPKAPKILMKMKVGPFKKEFSGILNGKELVLRGYKDRTDFDVYYNGHKIGSIRYILLIFQNDAYVTFCVDKSWRELVLALAVVADTTWNTDD